MPIENGAAARVEYVHRLERPIGVKQTFAADIEVSWEGDESAWTWVNVDFENDRAVWGYGADSGRNGKDAEMHAVIALLLTGRWDATDSQTRERS